MILRPDFLFFRVDAIGAVIADIVDRYGDFVADGVSKFRGLAGHTEKQGASFGRIEAVAETNGSVFILGRRSQGVRDMMRTVANLREAYHSQWGTPYG